MRQAAVANMAAVALQFFAGANLQPTLVAGRNALAVLIDDADLKRNVRRHLGHD